MSYESWKGLIESIGIRSAGPHKRVLDTVAEGPHPILKREFDYHCLVVCQDCGAEWPEGGEYPEDCGKRRVSLAKLLSWVRP